MRNIRFLPLSILQIILPLTSAVSLSNFQPFPDDISVPITCTLAYRSTIPGCENADFTNGAACSAACISGLNVIALGVNTACPGVIADSNSLLGNVFQGLLIPLLCPNTNTNTDTTSSTTTSSKTVATSKPSSTVTPPKVTVTPPAAPTQTPLPSPAPVTASKQPLSFTTKAVKSSADGGLGDGGVSSTTSSAQDAPTPAPVDSSTSSTKTTKPKATAKSGGGSAASQQAAADSKSGGGSPFDIQDGAARSAAVTSFGGPAAKLVVGCALFAGVLLVG